MESADKPGFVEDNHSSGQHVTMHLKRPTREQRGPRIMFPYLVLLRVGFTMPQAVTRCAVRSYRTISPLPTFKNTGGLFSAALSVGFHLPGVTWHSVLRSPDFPPQTDVWRDCLANSSCDFTLLSVESNSLKKQMMHF